MHLWRQCSINSMYCLNHQLDNGGGSSHPCPLLDHLKRWQSDHACRHPHRFNELATKIRMGNQDTACKHKTKDTTPSVNWKRGTWTSHLSQLEVRGMDITPSVNWRREAWTSCLQWSGGERHGHQTHRSTGGERHGHHTINQLEVRAVDITPSMKWRRGAQTSHHRLTRGERHGHHRIDEVEERDVAITPLIDWRREEWTLHHQSTGGERRGHHNISQLEKRGMERGSA